jgi:hypothetical protein
VPRRSLRLPPLHPLQEFCPEVLLPRNLPALLDVVPSSMTMCTLRILAESLILIPLLLVLHRVALALALAFTTFSIIARPCTSSSPSRLIFHTCSIGRGDRMFGT